MLLLNAVFKKKVRLSGPLVMPSLMTSLQEKQRFFFTGPWRGPGPGAVAPATPLSTVLLFDHFATKVSVTRYRIAFVSHSNNLSDTTFSQIHHCGYPIQDGFLYLLRS